MKQIKYYFKNLRGYFKTKPILSLFIPFLSLAFFTNVQAQSNHNNYDTLLPKRVVVLKTDSGNVTYLYLDSGRVVKFTSRSFKNALNSNQGEGHKVFTFVEHMPVFPGGEHALHQYLRDHLQYPEEARDSGIEGTVVVQFIVDTDGTIYDVKAVGYPRGGGLEKEAVRLVKNMPKWIPGEQNRKKVKVQYSLPVRFELPQK